MTMAISVTTSDTSVNTDPGSFLHIWEDARTRCEHVVPRPDWEKKGEPTRKILKSALPALERLEIAITVFDRSMQDAFEPAALIWGLLHQLFDASSKNPDQTKIVVSWLNNTSTDLCIFREYDWLFARDPTLRGVLVEIYVEVIDLWAKHIKPFQLDRKLEKKSLETPSDFEKVLPSISRGIEQMRDRTHAATARFLYESQSNLLRSSSSNSAAPRTQKFESSADPKVPIDNIPYPRNPWFCGRDELLATLETDLVPQGEPQEIKCRSLSGTAGIGKTQIALHYAIRRKELAVAKDEKAEKVILWIKCETSLQLAQSLREITTLLGLVEHEQDVDVEKCRLILFRWLAATEHKWLIVLDNVESDKLLRTIWPYGLKGAVLITSRHPMLATDLTGEGIEVAMFSDEEGSAFLQKLLARKSYPPEEKKSAESLSHELGGLPLALNLMGKQLKKSKGRKIGQFLEGYKRNPRRLQNIPKDEAQDVFYAETLATAWETSFKPLEQHPTSLALMSILCCLGPERIPEVLFQCEELGDFSDELEFCLDTIDFDEAMKPILEYSMVTSDVENGFMSIHRMIQSSFCDWREDDKVHTALLHTAKLLFEAFPKHRLGVSLRTDYTICRSLAPHILALVVRYRQYRFEPGESSASDDFTALLGSFAWYLMENNFWNECREVIEVGETICKDHTTLSYAHLCNTMAIIEYERGHAAEAWPYMKKALAIREDRLDSDDPAHCDTFSNHALLLMTENASPEKLEEAEQLFRKVVEFAKPHHDELYSVLHHHYTNLGVCLNHQGKYEEAMRWVIMGMDNAYNEHFRAASLYDLGNIHYNEARWEEAIKCFTEAERIFTSNNPLAPHATACQLKVGSIDIHQGYYEEAIKRLRRTLDLCRVAEKNKGDAGDTARVMRKLAEALEKSGGKLEGRLLRLEAEAIRRKLQGSRAQSLGDTERSYNMLVFVAFW